MFQKVMFYTQTQVNFRTWLIRTRALVCFQTKRYATNESLMAHFNQPWDRNITHGWLSRTASTRLVCVDTPIQHCLYIILFALYEKPGRPFSVWPLLPPTKISHRTDVYPFPAIFNVWFPKVFMSTFERAYQYIRPVILIANTCVL